MILGDVISVLLILCIGSGLNYKTEKKTVDACELPPENGGYFSRHNAGRHGISEIF